MQEKASILFDCFYRKFQPSAVWLCVFDNDITGVRPGRIRGSPLFLNVAVIGRKEEEGNGE